MIAPRRVKELLDINSAKAVGNLGLGRFSSQMPASRQTTPTRMTSRVRMTKPMAPKKVMAARTWMTWSRF